MNVIVVGNPRVGKTSMLVKLKEQESENLVITSDLSECFDPETGKIALTAEKREKPLEMKVKTRIGWRNIEFSWIDTPGEAWNSNDWRKSNVSQWQDITDSFKVSRSIMLLLPPYKDIVIGSKLNSFEDVEYSPKLDDFPSIDIWSHHFREWLKFFRTNCQQTNHLIICINKADLFRDDLIQIGHDYRSLPDQNRPDYSKYSDFIRRLYFSKVQAEIEDYHNHLGRQNSNKQLKFFITSTKNRNLLELPWMYVGTRLAFNQ